MVQSAQSTEHKGLVGDAGAWVVVGVLLTEHFDDWSAQLSVAARELKDGKFGDRVSIDTFPALHRTSDSLFNYDLASGLTPWLISTWERRDTGARVTWYELEPGNRPVDVKLPGQWSCLSQL